MIRRIGGDKVRVHLHFREPNMIEIQPVHNHNRSDGIYGFDARGIAKRFRHAAIFGALDSLVPGERMRFVNDHNPLPLLQQMMQRYGDKVEVNYLEQGEQGVVIDFIRV
jgi:uncharacterized protein (DUF2249 family)